MDEFGVHYMKFLKDLQPVEYGARDSMFHSRIAFIKRHHDFLERNAERTKLPPPDQDCDAWHIMRTIAAYCDVSGVRVRDWFKDLDWYTGKTTRERFRRCLGMAGVKIADWQLAVLEDR